jgi:hypothetical protein
LISIGNSGLLSLQCPPENLSDNLVDEKILKAVLTQEDAEAEPVAVGHLAS